MEVIKTHCYICNCRCGILAYVENGRVRKIEGDPDCEKNEGALCIKGRSMLELVYDEDRLGYPIKRNGDDWKRISWEEALSDISERLLSLKNEFGPESFALYRGMSVYSWLVGIYARRFVNVYGSPNLASNAALCVGSKVMATRFTYGKGVSPCGDLRNAKCILLFGTNPAITGMHRAIRVMQDIMKAKREGAKLIVIDPKKTETASKADIYTTIRPGTDGALVLSLINVIIERKLYDESFVSQYTYGFERLKELVANYTPEEVEKITWVDARTIREIAETFATGKPACADRREGIIHHENGTQTCRAINILNAITGNVDVKGGVLLCTNLLAGSSSLFNELTLKDRFSPRAPCISEENPLTQDVPMDVVKAILEGKPYPIRALIVLGSNPLLAWPNTNIIQKALKKLDLLVLVDIYRNDTAKFADIVLPAATFLEKTDIQAPDVAIPRVVQLLEKVVEPANESWSEFKIIQELAKKMGYGEYFRETEEELLDKVLNQWGLSVDVLRQNRSGIVFEPRDVGYYHRNGFPTESGKVEMFSEKLQTLGFDPLPEFKEPTESPLSNRALAEEFSLVLVTGNRVRSSYLSFLHNLPSLHGRNPENWVEIHPATAEARGIKDAEIVTVESPRGKIELKAKLTSKVDPRVVFIPYGWGHNYDGSWQLANSSPGESVNILTDHALTDGMSGMPNYKSLLCRVRK